MPKKFPPKFKRDVVRVARRGDLTHAEVAADVDDGVIDGPEHQRAERAGGAAP